MCVARACGPLKQSKKPEQLNRGKHPMFAQQELVSICVLVSCQLVLGKEPMMKRREREVCPGAHRWLCLFGSTGRNWERKGDLGVG